MFFKITAKGAAVMSKTVIKFENVSKEYFLYKNEKARFRLFSTIIRASSAIRYWTAFHSR